MLKTPNLHIPEPSPIVLIATYGVERDHDGAELAFCYTAADTFWSTFYFLASMALFFALPFVILVLLYAAIAYKLLRRGSAFQRPTSPTTTKSTTTAAAGVGTQLQRGRARRGAVLASNPAYKINSHQQMRQHRKQVIFMLITVVASFFVCLLPFRAFALWVIVSSADDIDALGLDGYYGLLYFCRVMLYLNSALNPILYNLMSSKFRTGFWRLIVSCCGGGAGDGNSTAPRYTGRQQSSQGRAGAADAAVAARRHHKSGRLLQRDATFVVSSISTSSGTERTASASSSSSWRGGSWAAAKQQQPAPLARSVGAAIVGITRPWAAALQQ